MKFGTRHDFHVIDGIGDLIAHFWRTRQSFTMQDLVRRFLKCAALVLVVYAMMYVLYPTQYRGWLLWLGPREEPLAKATAVVLVCFNAMILTLVREAWAHRHRGLAIGSGFFMAILMLVVLGGAWNYYAATSSRAVNASAAATGGATDRVAEAQARLKALDAREAASGEAVTAALRNASANVVTGRARLLAQQTEAAKASAGERQRLEAELVAARAANVSTQVSAFDPRPIDAVMAKWVGADRTFMGSINDLIRSMNFEFIAILGVALGTAVALSRAGAPRQEDVRATVALEDMRAMAKRQEEPQPGEAIVQRREVVYDEDGEPMVFRKATHARKPKFNKSGRAKDETDYEAAAQTVASDPRVSGEQMIDFTAGGPQETDDGNTLHQRRADRALDDEMDRDIGGENNTAGPSVDGGDGDDVDSASPRDIVDDAPPAPLTPERVQELIESGLVAENPDTGDLHYVSQEGAEQIDQPDQAHRYPALPAPVREEEAA